MNDTTSHKVVEFVAVTSGDHESFCWDTDYETVKRLYAAADWDDEPRRSYFYKNLYQLVPLFAEIDAPPKEKNIFYNVRIEISTGTGGRRTFTITTEPADLPLPLSKYE